MNNNASNPSTSNPTSTVVPDIYKKYMEPVVSLLMVHLLLLKPMDYPIIKVLTMLVQMHWLIIFLVPLWRVQFCKNPNSISEKSYVFKIPIDPKEASKHAATQLGAIGVSLNGIPFFNQYAGPNQPLAGEMVSFDRYWGHPAPTGQYHYHVEPLYLTTVKVTKSSLLGFLLDGFPVYGPEENGAAIDNSKLDAYHGHTSVTADYPNGIYHYHITPTDPYINGSGYYGTPGTVSQ